MRALLLALAAACLLSGLLTAASASALTFGLMNTGATNWTGEKSGPTESSEEWKVIGKSGAATFRIPIEPDQSASGSNWTFYDKVFRLASENGVTIQPFLSANGGAGLPYGTEKQKEEWFIWVKKAVKRYGYNGTFWAENPSVPARPVTAWEIWNEENVGIGAETYGAFLVYTAAAIQAASEEMAAVRTGVLFGGLLIWNGATTYQTYLKNAYKVPGVSTSVTGIAIHPYSVGSGTPLPTFQGEVTGARSFVNKELAGGSTKGLWLTEFGWPVRNEFPVSEQTQAELVAGSMSWLKAEAATLNIPSATYYNYRDSDFTGSWAYGCGLRDEVGNFRRSWFHFQNQAGAGVWPIPRTEMQANTGTLWNYTQGGGGVNTGVAMKAGTSPSAGQYAGGIKVSLQGSNGNLWTYTPGGGAVDTGFGMKAGTSPSITQLEDGVVAFQSSAGQLWTYQSGGPVVNTEQEVAAGSSPSITVVPDLYWRNKATYPVAYQAPGGELRIYNGGSVTKTGLLMAAGSSPTIVALDAPGPQYLVLFQANTGIMWYYTQSGSAGSLGYGMAAGTNPGLTSLPGGTFGKLWTGTFQANTGALWIYEPSGTVASTGLGMMSGSSPSMAAIGDFPYYRPWEVAFDVNTTQLWTYEPSGTIINTLLGQAANTSPSITPG